MSKTEKSQSPENIKPKAATSADEVENRLFNRELSWLEFNRRVLEEATVENLPVLERLKFLSIFSTNLDEFFMIRVSGLKEQIEEGVTERSPDGMTASEQMAELNRRLRPMLKKQASYLRETVLPELAEAGIKIESYKNLTVREKRLLDKYFREHLFPILTPQAVDSSHKFPYISNLSLNLGLFIEPDGEHIQQNLKHLFRQKRFARIKLPPTVSRIVPIDEKKGRFALLGEIIAANVHHLFPNMKCGECFLFRVTRDADMELREDEAGDLLRTMERELHRRRFGFAVRLEVQPSMPDKMVKVLTDGIGLNESDVYQIDGFVNIPDLMQFYSIDKPQLKEKQIPIVHLSILHEKKNVFEVLKKRDILLHHPYTAYSTVTDFIAAAADDADVQAIKICLYRTGKDSPIVNSLIRACQNGKQVTALVELKARFDEENNIEWARRLENEGVHVVYGIHTLKTHSKVALIVRREKEKLVRYVHLATGNYNPTTSRIYTDLGILTSDIEIGAEVTNLFNFLTGYSLQTDYKRLLVAPINMRQRFVKQIEREISHKKAGTEARIIVKINSLTDVEFIEELYKASNAGVEIDLIVRGICALRPGVKGISENIRVRSIVGRFLEHSRVFYFANGGDEEIYIGSADWMSRNLDRRVEVIVPIKEPKIRQYLKETLLDAYLRDTANTRVLNADGSYKRVSQNAAHNFSAQMFFVGQDIKT
ncbi:MAG TPA: polyphosphate kinase 1 [Pyrinomonadaceae bacterium]|nr:polyphosphate kinase 1 [Pyrinomonadaceae bacterium]